MKSLIVPIKNVSRLAAAGAALINRSYGMPGMGLIHGHTGFGKTTATSWYAQRCHAVYVRAKATWTPFVMLEDILKELDLAPRTRLAHMVDDVVRALAEHNRPLFIDEFDYVADSKRMSDCVRDLHDLSTMPVIAIGMADIAKKLRHREQFTGRIAQDVAFEACDAADARLLADKLCEVRIADDLLKASLAQSRGSVRLMVVGLAKFEAKARALGRADIGLREWGESAMFTGEAGAR